MKKTVYLVLPAFFAALLLFSGWKLTELLLSYKEGQDSYESLEQFVSFETREDPEISGTTAAQDESTVFPEVDFENNSFEQWLKETMARSCFIPADSPSPEDSVIKLSTCSYEFDTAKFVLHGYIAERIEKDTE